MGNFKKLSRDEMRKIAGGVNGACPCKAQCSGDDDCPGNEVCNTSPGASCMGSSPSCNYNVCIGKL